MTLRELHGALDHLLHGDLDVRHAPILVAVDDNTDPEGPLEIIGSVDVLYEGSMVHGILIHARNPR